MIEEWRDIKGFEGAYQVSNIGRVRSCSRYITYRSRKKHDYIRFYEGAMLLGNILPNGYERVRLSKDNRNIHKYVHRLVAEAFIENPHNFPEVNHKDENKQNNCIDNLEWCDKQYNVNYGTAMERGVKSRIDRGISRSVVLEEDDEIRIFPNMITAAKKTGISSQEICRRCKQGDAKWKYLESFILRKPVERTGLNQEEATAV